MKKMLVIATAVLMVVGICTLSHADLRSTSKDIILHVGVNDAFGFEVWDTELEQYLTAIDPGGVAFADVHIYATSNHSIPWTISGSSAGLVGSLQPTPETLPVEMNTFDGASVGLTGTTVTDLVLTPGAQPIYVSGSGEYPALGLQISALCVIKTTIGTQWDLYEGIVQLTMTE